MDLQTLLALGVLGFDTLNAHINNLPRISTRIGDMNLFQEEGLVGTTIVKIGIKDNKLVLVPNVPRGSPGQPKGLDRGKVKLLETTHLPQNSTVMADQLLGVWDPADPDGANVAAVVNGLQAVHKRDLDYTIEYHRMGALQGKLLDADGSVIVDFYDEFGVEQSTIGMELTKADTKVRSKVVSIKRAIEAKLGGVPYTGIHVFCSAGFFDALVDHPDVQEAYKRWQDGAALRSDLRKGFTFGDVTFEELPGGSGNSKIAIPDNEAIAFPLGVPDMFLTRFAPADYLETVRGIGLPYYSKTAPMRMNKGIQLESQSNPLNINTRPDAVIRLKPGAK